jgi:voltage-gated potassium channel
MTLSRKRPATVSRARPLLTLAALAAVASPDASREALDRLKGSLRRTYEEDPMETVVTTVALGALLFYRAEAGKNPKVRSYWDALVYVSTNLSVGYCDIFAVTEAGKAIGSVLMTYGPAMAAGMLAKPRAERDAAPEDARVVERLEKVLAALERLNQNVTSGLSASASAGLPNR